MNILLAESFLTKQIGWFQVWQILPVILLAVLLIFWKQYRDKQM